MGKSIEVAKIDNIDIPFDVTKIQNGELWFCATDIAKHFGKKANDWLKINETQEYLDALFKVEDLRLKNLVSIKKGKYGGTWLNQRLRLPFSRWCSALFAVRLDRWIENRFAVEEERALGRLESKTGFLALSAAIANAHEKVKPYHFSNESNLLYSIILGMSAKAYKELNGVESVRENLTPEQLAQLNELQFLNTALIMMNESYPSRKDTLRAFHENKSLPKLARNNSCTGGETIVRDDFSWTLSDQESAM